MTCQEAIDKTAMSTISSTGQNNQTTMRSPSISFIGNSMIYYNDCPTLVSDMLECEFHHNSCLRGGATLTSLWEEGHGMKDTDGYGAQTVTELMEASMDFSERICVVNDFTQGPCRQSTRQTSLETLRNHYAPLWNRCGTNHVIWIQTPAYREPTNGSEDLGTIEKFTQLLFDGVNEYIDCLTQEFQLQATMVPVGEAYLMLYQTKRSLWEKLFCHDNFHPSPHGTLLQAFLVVGLIRGVDSIPTYKMDWLKRSSRYRRGNMPLPTTEEAELLRKCSIDILHKHESPKASL